ncbi:MAG: 16S rRNA (cytidine(1402)-2'-O)-methyltransferase [Candidatus Kaiserbacteria bacterium]|nr:16S rRNA (cytidine(1402)-2'-O)-methyltransferase [Candidatus Kaiserbacteria bacterium]
MAGTVYVVGTPIGNLGDMTTRGVETLQKVDTIFCEDTRVTKKLLARYKIDTSCVSYHSFSGFGKIAQAIKLLQQEKDIALVSDAGTPTISDPGVKLVRHIREKLGEATDIRTVPGASAVTAALSISGAPSSSFLFLGFLPRKKGRKTLFKEIAEEKRTVVCYEAPHRLLKTLTALQESLDPTREVIVAREMTKVYEQVITGTAAEVLAHYTTHSDEVRGEVVIIISGLHRTQSVQKFRR